MNRQFHNWETEFGWFMPPLQIREPPPDPPVAGTPPPVVAPKPQDYEGFGLPTPHCGCKKKQKTKMKKMLPHIVFYSCNLFLCKFQNFSRKKKKTKHFLALIIKKGI